MKFKYKRYGDILRPVISLRIKYRSKTVLCGMLVDSGSDDSLLDESYAEEFGIDLKKGELRTATGVAGQSVPYYVHIVDIEIGGETYPAEVGFVPRGPVDYGIAGQKGFFDKFIVKFDLLKEEIELKKNR